jgi:hypothetical protein
MLNWICIFWLPRVWKKCLCVLIKNCLLIICPTFGNEFPHHHLTSFGRALDERRIKQILQAWWMQGELESKLCGCESHPVLPSWLLSLQTLQVDRLFEYFAWAIHLCDMFAEAGKLFINFITHCSVFSCHSNTRALGFRSEYWGIYILTDALRWLWKLYVKGARSCLFCLCLTLIHLCLCVFFFQPFMKA